HGKDGILRFPDGSSSSFSEMARQCAAEGKICVFPTCVLRQEPGQDPGLDSLDSYICLKNPAESLGTLRSFGLRDHNRISLAELVAKIKGYVFPLHYIVDKSVGGAVVGLIISEHARPRPKPGGVNFQGASANTQGPDTRPISLNAPRPAYTEEA